MNDNRESLDENPFFVTANINGDERRATTYLAFNQISHKQDEAECANKIMLVE